jgi:hypothetical protein
MSSTPNRRRSNAGNQRDLTRPPRYTLLEALESAIDGFVEIDSGEWQPDTQSLDDVLNEYREAVAWAKRQKTLFIVTDEDVHAFAKDSGLVTPLSHDELRRIRRSLKHCLAVALEECLTAALVRVIDDRVARRLKANRHPPSR